MNARQRAKHAKNLKRYPVTELDLMLGFDCLDWTFRRLCARMKKRALRDENHESFLWMGNRATAVHARKYRARKGRKIK